MYSLIAILALIVNFILNWETIRNTKLREISGDQAQGHAAGDEYLKASAKLLCDIFVHSPVFRIGGDEFVVFLRGSDYADKEMYKNKQWLKACA